MAVPRRIPLAFGVVFPVGAFVVGVDPVNDFDKVRAGVADAQQRDEETGDLVWQVKVIDADPDARTNEVKIRMTAPVQPVPPDLLPGTPFRPVEFDGLSITPYIDRRNAERPKIAYSLRASGMRAPAALNGRRPAPGVAA
ncbi:Plasmid replication, integration and excision activator [Frankia canadensis]|uniref:Plasmid replication, integration and excision activator n=1 Tax=Frankia canadensis TaxID=1836972 RepID=A0A2I2L149_9ACTN|nr:plasmid replication, integration and excision activator [Frankia canadensis]SNQ51653.1 Plasmid replication, integration and excision activator [Frankia canadensis]SOU58943.1 Plasmid replication, integration and excision activator [Frankia canadensis]